MIRSDFLKRNSVFVSIATNAGRVRAANEDNFYGDELGIRVPQELCGHRILSSRSGFVFAVCDGMGGEQFGDTASEIAVQTLAGYAEKIKSTPIERLCEVINEYASEANDRICAMTLERNANLSGSTFAMVCIRDGLAYPFSIGDSRIYFRIGDTLKQISEDQTLAVKKLKANIYTEDEARLSPDSHKLTTFLGVDSRKIGLKALAYDPLDLSMGDILICSDGLTDMCSDEQILSVLTSKNDSFVSQHLVEAALQNGGIDNITCILIKKA